MTSNPAPRPTATIDSIASFLIAETYAYAMMNRDDFNTTLHAFDDDDDSLTRTDRIRRFIDIDLDELRDNDTIDHFANPDDIDILAIINDDRLYAMLELSYTELCDLLNIDN